MNKKASYIVVLESKLDGVKHYASVIDIDEGNGSFYIELVSKDGSSLFNKKQASYLVKELKKTNPEYKVYYEEDNSIDTVFNNY